jgi:regulator of RNase E activity RraA
LPSELVQRAAAIEPATIGHVVNHGFAIGITPVTTANRFVGTALTVRLSPMDGTALHYAADQVQPGHVVVIDMGQDTERASVGAMVAFVLGLRGAAGVVIDGMATDIEDLQRTGVPIFSRGLRPVTTRILGHDGDINLPVSVGGSIVRPGDLVIADPNGVVFIDPIEFADQYDHLVHLQDLEPPARDELRAGLPL